MPKLNRLTIEDKKNIAELYATGEFNQSELARKFDTSRRSVQRVLLSADLLILVTDQHHKSKGQPVRNYRWLWELGQDHD